MKRARVVRRGERAQRLPLRRTRARRSKGRRCDRHSFVVRLGRQLDLLKALSNSLSIRINFVSNPYESFIFQRVFSSPADEVSDSNTSGIESVARAKAPGTGAPGMTAEHPLARLATGVVLAEGYERRCSPWVSPSDSVNSRRSKT
jgi:hypothetical protein